MINLLQETKKKVEEKNLLSRFPEFDRRSIFAAALYEKLAAEEQINSSLRKTF